MMVATQFSASFDGFMVVGYERDKMLACQTARMQYKNMFTVDPYLPYILPADADGATLPPANAPAPIMAMNFDGDGPRPGPAPDLERDARLVGHAVDQRHVRAQPPGGGLRLEPLRLRAELHPAARHVGEAGHARRPPHAPRAVPELRRLADARRKPLRRHRRRPRRCALVPDREGRRRQLGHQGPGDVRARCRQPLDAERRDGQERQPRARLLGGERHGERYFPSVRVHGPPRDRSAGPDAGRGDDHGRRRVADRTRPAAGATTR